MTRGRTDANQGDIVRDWRDIGASVVDLSQVGGGCPDVLIGYRGRSWLLEIKTASGKLRPSQLVFRDEWRGCPVIVARSFDESLAAVHAHLRRGK